MIFLKYRALLFLSLSFWLAVPASGQDEPLTLSYFERPPYYYTTASGEPAGFLVARTQKIFQEAGIPTQYISSTPYRILYVVQHAVRPHCSLGWFKNAERELFAKFSAPIYRDQALVLLASTAQRKRIGSYRTLREVFSDPQLTMARMSEFSYGETVDKLLGVFTPKSLFLTGQQGDLLRAVAEQRAAYMLVAPEEVDMLVLSAGLAKNDFFALALEDLPAGNLRYLMCNQAVDDGTLRQLNGAIGKLFPVH